MVMTTFPDNNSGGMKTNCHMLWISVKIIKTIVQLVDKLIYLHRLVCHNNEVILQLWDAIFLLRDMCIYIT